MLNLGSPGTWKVAEMANFFDKLPTILVLAVLVGIFVALRRHVKSPRLDLWIAAWGLIFAHFIADWLASADPNTSLMLVASEVSLQLSAIFFIASLTSFFENRKLTGALIMLFAVPMVTYTTALLYRSEEHTSEL